MFDDGPWSCVIVVQFIHILTKPGDRDQVGVALSVAALLVGHEVVEADTPVGAGPGEGNVALVQQLDDMRTGDIENIVRLSDRGLSRLTHAARPHLRQ